MMHCMMHGSCSVVFMVHVSHIYMFQVSCLLTCFIERLKAGVEKEQRALFGRSAERTTKPEKVRQQKAKWDHLLEQPSRPTIENTDDVGRERKKKQRRSENIAAGRTIDSTFRSSMRHRGSSRITAAESGHSGTSSCSSSNASPAPPVAGTRWTGGRLGSRVELVPSFFEAEGKLSRPNGLNQGIRAARDRELEQQQRRRRRRRRQRRWLKEHDDSEVEPPHTTTDSYSLRLAAAAAVVAKQQRKQQQKKNQSGGKTTIETEKKNCWPTKPKPAGVLLAGFWVP